MITSVLRNTLVIRIKQFRHNTRTNVSSQGRVPKRFENLSEMDYARRLATTRFRQRKNKRIKQNVSDTQWRLFQVRRESLTKDFQVSRNCSPAIILLENRNEMITNTVHTSIRITMLYDNRDHRDVHGGPEIYTKHCSSEKNQSYTKVMVRF